jgi:hypothetical protein
MQVFKTLFKTTVVATVLTFSCLSQAEVNLTVYSEYVDLTARTPKEFIFKLKNVDRPMAGDGYGYAWIISDTSNDTSYKTTEAGCKLRRINSDLNITITTPRWTNIIKSTEAFQKAAMGMTPQPKCRDVKGDYRDLKRKFAGQIRDSDYALDYKNNVRIKIKDLLHLERLPAVTQSGVEL